MSGKVIAIANQKGGVGKTTAAVHIAFGLSLSGVRTLLVDFGNPAQCDLALGLRKAGEPQQGGLFRFLRGDNVIRPAGRNNLWLVGSGCLEDYDVTENGALMMNTRTRLAETEFDYVVLDTLPMSLYQQELYRAADWVIIPTFSYTLDSTSTTINTLTSLSEQGWSGRISILPVLEKEEKDDEWAHRWGIPVLPAVFRSPLFSRAMRYKKTVLEYAPHSKQAKAYLKVVQQIKEGM